MSQGRSRACLEAEDGKGRGGRDRCGPGRRASGVGAIRECVCPVTPPFARHDSVSTGVIDLTDEASIQAAAEQIGSPLDLVLVATGILHEDGRMPEKALSEFDGAVLARIFQINTIGPALVLKHFAPLLAKIGARS
jgi:NAD(P)-dependent dehydrogenase (short-subunit alcohol dehydrogenase family)